MQLNGHNKLEELQTITKANPVVRNKQKEQKGETEATRKLVVQARSFKRLCEHTNGY